MTCSFK